MKPSNSDFSLTPGALLNRTVALLDRQSLDQTIASLQNEIEAKPTDYALRVQLAMCLQRSKQPHEALSHIETAANIMSNNFDVRLLHASILFDLGRPLDCLKQLRVLAEAHPQMATVWKLSSIAFTKIGRHIEALQAITRALQLDPNDAESLFQRAAALEAAGNLNEAVEAYRLVLRHQPQNPSIHSNLGVVLKRLGDRESAIHEWSEALQYQPQYYEALMNRGLAFLEAEAWDAAERDIALVLDRKPADQEALFAAATIAHRRGALEAARLRYQRLLTSHPDHARGVWNLGLLELSVGQFELGWPMYEARQRQEEFKATYSRPIPYPRLSSLESARGGTILLLHEQGLGDTLQFCRFAKLLRQHAAKVTVLAPKSLHRVLLSSGNINDVVSEIQTDEHYDNFEYLMSLPRHAGSTLEALKMLTPPYLFADPELIAAWKTRLQHIEGPRIGAMWSGGTLSKIKGRSITLEAFMSMIPSGISVISLQKEIKETDQALINHAAHIHHYGDLQTDFADAAAMIENVDLVISVDTSVAHLAAAMGKETWIVLPHAADWRWMTVRNDSPWYPTATLYRQKNQDDWTNVIQEVRRELSRRFSRSIRTESRTLDQP